MASARRRFTKEERTYLRRLVLDDLERNKELTAFLRKPLDKLLEKLTSVDEAINEQASQ